MKSAILKNGKIEIVEKNIPDLKDKKGAIIKVFGCGLCGSDIVKIHHATPENENNIVLGHEITGEIVDINIDIIEILFFRYFLLKNYGFYNIFNLMYDFINKKKL